MILIVELITEVLAAVLLALNIAVIIHIKRGTDNKWLIAVTAMLLVNNATLLGYIFVFKQTTLEIWIEGFLNATFFVSYNLSHLMLALKYKRISENIPH